ncbi:MAG TPA: hypothetical protein VMD30_05945 [Tepidisphaeraceae bacterium]|nr:hypothetical protein [Tepidisphaeraceae bacterium]
MSSRRPLSHWCLLIALCAALITLLWLYGSLSSPQIDAAATSLTRGEIPLWHGTAPLLASGNAAIFFPINLLLLFLPPHWAWPAIWGLNFLVATIGVWLLQIPAKVETTHGRFLATAIYAIDIFLFAIWSKPQAEVLVCLPWVILCTQWLIAQITPFRLAVTCLILATQFLAGNIAMLTAAIPAEIIVAFFLAGRRPWRATVLSPAIAIAAALAAIQFVPSLALVFRNAPPHLVWPALAARCCALAACLTLLYLLRYAKWPVQWLLIATAAAQLCIAAIAIFLPSSTSLSTSHPQIWEMPSARYVATSQQALALAANPHQQLVVDGQFANPYNEPIGRIQFQPPTLSNPPLPGQAESDRHWWTHTAPAGDTIDTDFADGQTIIINLTGDGGWLIITNPYDPDWQAYLQSSLRQRRQISLSMFNTPIVRANGKFQAIFVPPGVRRVVFRYDPASWRYALFTSAAGLAMLVLLLGIGLASPRLPRSHGGSHDGMDLAQRSDAALSRSAHLG